MNTQRLTWSLLVAAAAVTAACGDSKSSMNPTAPSAVVMSAQNQEPSSGDAVFTASGKPANPGNGNGNGNNGNGNGNGNGNDNGKGKDQPTVPTTPTAPGNVTPPTNTTPSAPVTKKVELEGLIAAKGSNTITVNGQVVTVPASAVIRHGSTTFMFANLHVGDRVHVKAMLSTTTGSALSASSTLEAIEVKLQNPGDTGDDDGDDDGGVPPVTQLVSVAALDATASETGPDLGAFQFTRSGATTAALTVTFTLTGTATNGTDYQSLSLTVTFAVGQSTAIALVTPLPDATAEGAETVILTVVDGAGYTAGSPATATVTIAG